MQTKEIVFTKRAEEKTTFVIDRIIYLRSRWGNYFMVAPNMVLQMINSFDHGTGQPKNTMLQVKTEPEAAVEPISKWLNGTEQMEEMPADEFWALWFKGVGLVCKANELYGKQVGLDAELVTLKMTEL